MARRVGLSAAIFLMILPVALVAAEAQQYVRHAEKPYAEVIDDLRFAVAEHNFRITSSNEIGAAITARGIDTMPLSMVMHICNLDYAGRILKSAPDRLLDMPCRLAVYQDDTGVMIRARLIDQTDERVADIAARVNAMLRDIVDFAAEPAD